MPLGSGDQRAYEFARETWRIEFSERSELESVSAIRSDVSARGRERFMQCVRMELTWFLFRWDGNPGRGSRVRKLRRYFDTTLETRRHRPLPLQRLRPLLQDERPESTPHQAEATPGKYLSCVTLLITILERADDIICGKRSIKLLHDGKKIAIFMILSFHVRGKYFIYIPSNSYIFYWA